MNANRFFVFLLTITLLATTAAVAATPVSAAPERAGNSPGAAISRALEALKAADPLAANLMIGTIQANETHAVVFLRDADPAVYPFTPLIVAFFDATDMDWKALSPQVDGAAAFNQVLAGVPDALLDPASRAYFAAPVAAPIRSGPLTDAGAQADAGIAALLAGHKLPWQAGTTAVVTQKDGTYHMNQIDFVIANDLVYASKPGTVLYVKESSPDPASPQCINDGVTWKKGNYVVIKHSETEYSWYMHFTYNGVAVQVGQALAPGAYIGKQGRTGYTCGTTGIHLHYMATTAMPPLNWFPDPSDPNDATWPDPATITQVNFAEVAWAAIVPYQNYTSQNVDSTIPVAQLPAGATQCASDGEVCNFDGVGTVYFGVAGAYYGQPNISMSIPCAASSFGDPAPGQAKACYVAISGPAPACPTPTDGAKLYSGTACQGSVYKAGLGLAKLEATTFNDLAQSIALPAGWSARAYKNNAEAEADSLCLTATDKNLNDNTFASGSSLANAITWLRVFNTPLCTPPSAPAAFGKAGPADGATNQPLATTINWTASSGVESYEYCYDTTDDDACSGWISKGISKPSKPLSLAANTTYYWQVRAVNSGGITYADGDEGSYWSFSTGAATFAKSSPANAASGVSASTTLKWAALSGATSYDVCWETTAHAANDTTCVAWKNVGTATSKAVSGLAGSSTYYWQVRANTAGGPVYANNGTWWSFTTTAGKPAAPTGLTASDKTYTDKIVLNWTASAGANNYKIYRSTSTTIPSSPVATGVVGTTYTDTAASAGKTHYYWVRACNTAGCSAPSAYNAGSRLVAPTVDLTVKSITLNNTGISLAKPAKLTIKVKNNGNTASGAFLLRVYDGAKPAGCGIAGALDVSVASLAAGSAVDIAVSLPFASTGVHSIYAMADPLCALSESVETNNIYGPFTVSVSPGP